MDKGTNCHLHYSPVDCSVGLPELDYAQSKFPSMASALATAATSSPLAAIEPNNNNNNHSNNVTYTSHWPKRPPLSPAAIDLNTNPTTAFTKSLKDMNGENLVKLLFTDTAPTGSSPPVGQPKHKARDPLVCMDEKDIIELLHKSGSSPPPIRPCDTSNPSNTKLHWTAKELHCIMGFS